MKTVIGMMLIGAALLVGVAGGMDRGIGQLTLPAVIVLAVIGVGLVEEPRIYGRLR